MSVWSFDVDVVTGNVKRTFTANTSIRWQVLVDEVMINLGDSPKPVQLTCKVTGDTGRMSHLNNVVDWDTILTRLINKVKTARTHAVSLEIKNVVSFVTCE